MRVEKILEAEKEAELFLEKLRAMKVVLMKQGESVLICGCRESAGLKRASMELSNKLIELRKP